MVIGGTNMEALVAVRLLDMQDLLRPAGAPLELERLLHGQGAPMGAGVRRHCNRCRR